MRKISTTILASIVIASMTGCALNPFAEDNIYKRKDTDNAANTTKARSAGEISAKFDQADADNNDVVSKAEADKVPGLAAIFEKYNPDRDGSLDWNEFNTALQSMNVSQN